VHGQGGHAPGPAARPTRYRQQAIFRPRGLAGHAYWWTVWPFHGLVFGAMTRNIATAAERSPRDGTLT